MIWAWTETSSELTGSSRSSSSGSTGERPGDPHPLPLAARQLVRVARGVLGTQSHVGQQRRDPPPSLGRGRPDPMDREHLVDRRPRRRSAG